jgi:hypothetical protein
LDCDSGTTVATSSALELSMRLPLLCAAAITILPALALPFMPAIHMTPAANAAPLAVPTPADPAAPLVGTYECQGVEPDGTPYQGIVRIIPNHGAYDVVWNFSSGQQYSGLGVVNGDVLAVSYFTNRPGVVAYKIETSDKGPRLSGQWTVVGATNVFQETLTRMTHEVKQPEPPVEPERRRPVFLPNLRPA